MAAAAAAAVAAECARLGAENKNKFSKVVLLKVLKCCCRNLPLGIINSIVKHKVVMDFDPGDTPQGKLPPWEVAKAVAFEQVIICMEEHLGQTCWQLIGKGKADFTAEQLTVVGGGHPSG